MEEILGGMCDAARRAGRVILEEDGHLRSVHSKGGHANLVTEVDSRVQRQLIRELSQLLPQARFIGEEEGQDLFVREDARGYAFCIDPIDGTVNYVKGYRPSMVSIALLKDGRPFMAAVYQPFDDLMFTAVRGQGAFMNGERLSSSEDPLSDSLCIFGSAIYYTELLEDSVQLMKEYMTRCLDIRRSGSAANDLCAMARGVAGVFFELRLGLWDFAAAGLVATEAGCRLTDIRGRELTYDGPSSVLCVSRGVAREAYLPRTPLRSLETAKEEQP